MRQRSVASRKPLARALRRKKPATAGSANGKQASRRIFVVQKHDASSLHYDFRLEHDGTLKSWAVPKGPNLDPAVKSLAVQVEDHPRGYAEFEGVIPRGKYGGGTVMVWDRGTWEPEEDPAKGLRQGKLNFQLHGDKLKGGWVLVRMGGRAGDGGKNWLLIKLRDSAARPNAKTDFLARHARSVITGRTMEEIAAADRASSSGKATSRKPATSRKSTRIMKTSKKVPKKRAIEKPVTRRGRRRSPSRRSAPPTAADVADLPGARRARLPRAFKPQLATLSDAAPVGNNWLHELKYDGYRTLAFLSGGNARLVSRNGKDWTHRFPTLAAAIADLPIDTALLDGEIVFLDVGGRSDFQKLQNFLRHGDDTKLVYYLFDAPYLAGHDLTDTPLVDRKQALAQLLRAAAAATSGPLRFSDHVRGSGHEALARACGDNQEGIVSKSADGPYKQFRSPSWLKTKCHQRQEFVIGGYTRPNRSRDGLGALLLGHYRHGDLIYSGRVGTGFTHESLRELAAILKRRSRVSCPFADPPAATDTRGVRWVKPELVCEVEFTEWTDSGRLRHPSFKGLRTDKSAHEVVREEPKNAAEV